MLASRSATRPRQIFESPNSLAGPRCRAVQRPTCVATGPSRRDPSSAPPAPTQGTVVPFRIPRSLSEVDNGKILGFGADLAEEHPGYHDAAYKQRRVDICNLARSHVVGTPIPRVEYSAQETAVWASVLAELEPLHARHACAAFLRTYPMFGFTPAAVPQLEDLSNALLRTTGWRVRPTAGLLHPRDFLAGLAFRAFHSTQYMRHHSRPNYTPEPDLIHEALGHVPMLADSGFAELARRIGAASLGADDATIWALTKIYWYTVEFGVIREGGEIKAFGAGILSSYGEMENMAAGAAELVPFDPFVRLPAMSYKDGYQRRYFVLESFKEAAAALGEYCEAVRAGQSPAVREAVDAALAAAQE